MGLLSGYLKVAYETNRSVWEETLDVMAADSALASLVSETTWRTGLTERAGRKILDLAGQGIVSLEDFSLWVFGAEINNLAPKLLNAWLHYLLAHEAPRARVIGLGFFYRAYASSSAAPPMPVDLAKRFLLHVDLFSQLQHGSMDEFYWSEVASRLIAQGAKFGVPLLEGVLNQWTSHDGGVWNDSQSTSWRAL